MKQSKAQQRTSKEPDPDLSHLKVEYEEGLKEFQTHADTIVALEKARAEVRGLFIEKLARQGMDVRPILKKCDSQMERLLKGTQGRAKQ